MEEEESENKNKPKIVLRKLTTHKWQSVKATLINSKNISKAHSEMQKQGQLQKNLQVIRELEKDNGTSERYSTDSSFDIVSKSKLVGAVQIKHMTTNFRPETDSNIGCSSDFKIKTTFSPKVKKTANKMSSPQAKKKIGSLNLINITP